jgi:methyl-accepting chemotaxis protein
LKTTEEAIKPTLDELQQTLKSLKNISDNIEEVTSDMKTLSGSVKDVGLTIKHVSGVVEDITSAVAINASGAKVGIKTGLMVLLNNLFSKKGG